MSENNEEEIPILKEAIVVYSSKGRAISDFTIEASYKRFLKKIQKAQGQDKAVFEYSTMNIIHRIVQGAKNHEIRCLKFALLKENAHEEIQKNGTEKTSVESNNDDSEKETVDSEKETVDSNVKAKDNVKKVEETTKSVDAQQSILPKELLDQINDQTDILKLNTLIQISITKSKNPNEDKDRWLAIKKEATKRREFLERAKNELTHKPEKESAA